MRITLKPMPLMKPTFSFNGLVIASLTVLTAHVVLADDRDDRILQLEKRLEILEQKNKTLEEKTSNQETKAAERK